VNDAEAQPKHMTRPKGANDTSVSEYLTGAIAT